jgi:hypothetical protein
MVLTGSHFLARRGMAMDLTEQQATLILSYLVLQAGGMIVVPPQEEVLAQVSFTNLAVTADEATGNGIITVTPVQKREPQ